MKKAYSISEIRQIVREVLKEAPPSRVSKILPSGNAPKISGQEPIVHKTNRRYGTGGESYDVPDEKIDPKANTQIPPTMHPPTIPASASRAEQAASQDLRDKNLGQPNLNANRIPRDKSPNADKTLRVQKLLKSKGMDVEFESLQQWINQMDPGDALIKNDNDIMNDWLRSQQGHAQTG